MILPAVVQHIGNIAGTAVSVKSAGVTSKALVQDIEKMDSLYAEIKSGISGLEKAKKSFTYAVVGIVVALSAFIIINLIASFTGVNIIRNFSIPTS